MSETVLKAVDLQYALGNSMKLLKNLYYFLTHREYRKAQLEIYSLCSILLNRRQLRKDYIEVTSKRYVENIKKCIAAGYQPTDHRHVDQNFWRKELGRSI